MIVTCSEYLDTDNLEESLCLIILGRMSRCQDMGFVFKAVADIACENEGVCSHTRGACACANTTVFS